MSEATHKLVSTREGGPTFEIISYNPETKTGKLRGNYGTVFEHSMDVEHLKKLGYKVVAVKPQPA